MIRKDDRVIGKVSQLNGLIGRCTNVIGTGNKRRYSITFDNGVVREVAKRSIDLYTESATLAQQNSRTSVVAAPATVNIAEGGSEKGSNDNSSDSSSVDSDSENDTSR